MQLIFLISLTMVAFAANSILNRVAVEGGFASPSGFALVRMAAGAAVLLLLTRLAGRWPGFSGLGRWGGAVSLSVYMIGFSLAYRSLDAGAGALILFGATQIVMFGMSGVVGAAPGLRQIMGAGIAFAGLAWVLWPGSGAVVSPTGAALMVAAGVGWAVYSLIGRTEVDALAASAGNFCLSLPFVALVWGVLDDPAPMTGSGIGLAAVSGAVTSGLGYALWYRILPMISGVTAATVMLSVPVIALLAGALMLGETLSTRLIAATAIVLGGIAVAVRPVRTR